MSETTDKVPLTADRVNRQGRILESQPELDGVDLDRLADELYQLMVAEALQERERGAVRGTQEK